MDNVSQEAATVLTVDRRHPSPTHCPLPGKKQHNVTDQGYCDIFTALHYSGAQLV